MDQVYVSSREAAIELGISIRRVEALASNDLILGAIKLGDGPRAHWMIPSPVIRIRANYGPRRRPGTPRHLLKGLV